MLTSYPSNLTSVFWRYPGVFLLISFLLLSSVLGAQKMMQGSITSMGANFRNTSNQVSLNVGGVNNGYKMYSDDSFSSGFIHCSLIYSFDKPDVGEDGYSIFPNPTSDEIQILFGELLNENYSVNVYDGIGKLVIEEKIFKETYGVILDFSHLSKGVYHVRVFTSDEVEINEKIVRN